MFSPSKFITMTGQNRHKCLSKNNKKIERGIFVATSICKAGVPILEDDEICLPISFKQDRAVLTGASIFIARLENKNTFSTCAYDGNKHGVCAEGPIKEIQLVARLAKQWLSGKKWWRVENYAIFIILKPFRARPGLIQEIVVKNVAILARTCPQRTHVLSKVGDCCFLWIVYITWNFYDSLTGLQKSVLFVNKRLL